jgi:tRNA pseudouridine55 synthase
MNLLDTNWAQGGMLLIDKPLEWTSHDAIKKIKFLLGRPKIGHSGTLDPLATGLLIACTGKWTKKLTELTGLPKQYTGTFTIGSTTASFDLETTPENFMDYNHITEELIIKTTEQFTGTITQIPPKYSAIKQDGKPIYLLARQGLPVDVKPRIVTITNFTITKIDLPLIHFSINCSTGTYIRSIAQDFGEALGVGGHLSSLRRTMIGEHHVHDAFTIEQIIEQTKI